MILGYGLILFALAATLGACVLFALSARRRGGDADARLVRLARTFVVLAAGGIVGASVYLMSLIASHQFQVAYVAEFTARRAAPKYLFAAFWGGQQGSILLWAFWTALVGTVLAWRAGGRENRVWPIVGVVQAFLLVLLTVKSPFALGTGPVPADGQGLNPLLENPWMVIHPPMLFLGFASLVAPFAWTVHGLLSRDWDGWVKGAFPWVLWAFSVLGFGIALGGYWAYETLGWGGFWAWDPVENASVVPWLFLTGLLHGMAIQRANGGYKVTNLLLGFLPFAFMIWGTFLTRTGLLADFSVHSFSALGKDGFGLLLGAVLAATFVPLGLLIARFRSIPKPVAYERVASREFGFFIASALLGIIGLITAVGMSAPLITKLWTPKGAAAQASFYNQANYPLAILLAVGMAATPYFAWRATNTDGVLKRLFPAYAASIVLTFAMLLLGGRDPFMLLLFAAGTFAVLTNVLLIAPRLKRRESRRTIGGFVAHAGVGLALTGIACLVAFSRSERVTLIKDLPREAMGFRLTYLGMSSQPYDRENALRIQVERIKDGKTWEARPHLFIAPLGGKNELFANPPAIFPQAAYTPAAFVGYVADLFAFRNPYPFGDLYIAHQRGPISQDEHNPNAGFQLRAREEKTVGDYKFKFWGADFDDEVREALKIGPEALAKIPEIRVRGLIDVTYKGGQTVSLKPEMVMDPRGGSISAPVAIPGAPNAVLTFDTFQGPFAPAAFSTTNVPDPTESLMIDVSTKPMIGLVWLGTILYTLGGLIAWRRRALETGLLGPGDGPAGDNKEPTAKPAPASKSWYRDRNNVSQAAKTKRKGGPAAQPARASASPRRR